MAQTPATIGRFQIRAELGQGAFGTVYRAFDPQFGREVALKVPHPGTLANPKACERFLRPAENQVLSYCGDGFIRVLQLPF
jgi:serine/threonine protein kinase